MNSLDSLYKLRQPFIFDNGPLYHEFCSDEFVKEPWNAYSSLVFFIPVIYWFWRLRGEYNQHKFLVFILPFLFLNGLGSTLFHAFRIHNFFLYLDFMPALVVNISVSTYLWTKVLGKWYYGLLTIIGFYVLSFTVIRFLPEYRGGAANIGYAFVGLSFAIPLFIILARTKFYKWHLIALTMLSLGLALTFRILDFPNPNPFPNVFPQGTHFLWHIVSSFAVFFLGGYIYHLDKRIKRK